MTDSTKANFDIGNYFSSAWAAFTGNLGPFLVGAVVFLVVMAVGNGVTWGIGSMVLGGPILFGLYKISAAALRGQPVEMNDVFAGFQKFLPCFLAYLLVSIFSIIGFVLCILPGIFVTLIYLPTFLFILDDDQEFWDAMESSRKMVMGNLGQWFILGLVIFAINLAGAIPCGLGFFVSFPLSTLLVTRAYIAERGGMTPAAPPEAPIDPAP